MLRVLAVRLGVEHVRVASAAWVRCYEARIVRLDGRKERSID
jgi:hypothetical protein